RSPQNGGFHKCTGGGPLPLAPRALLTSPSSPVALLACLSFAIVDPTLAVPEPIRVGPGSPPTTRSECRKIAGLCIECGSTALGIRASIGWHDYCLGVAEPPDGRHHADLN